MFSQKKKLCDASSIHAIHAAWRWFNQLHPVTREGIAVWL
jgi:hypothetical protein